MGVATSPRGHVAAWPARGADTIGDMPSPARSADRSCGDVPLPVLRSQGSPAPRVKHGSISAWRFGVLGFIQLLMVVHVVAWLAGGRGRTLSPLEPSEAMRTVKDGVVNAGAVLFGVALLSTLVLGRFFCGWGCHILLLQDGCAWILRKLGVHLAPFRSRLLLWLPLGLALWMFAWPVVYHVAVAPWIPDHPRWPGFSQEFMVTDFWQTFPGVVMAVPFLLVCGCVAVWFLGQKGFCTYACPYGGFFAPLDRYAPLRIRVNDDCEQCGHCTAVCTSNVRVHEEVARHGMVVDPGCMKCLDCVHACPNDALRVGWGTPAAFAPEPAAAPAAGRAHSLSWTEEILVAATALVTLLALNAPFAAADGIKVTLPLLFAGGVAACAAFCVFKGWRILTRRDVSFHRLPLRRAGRVAPGGILWLLVCAAGGLMVLSVGAQNVALAVADRADRAIVAPVGVVFSPAPSDAPASVIASARRADWWYRIASTVEQGGVAMLPVAQSAVDVRRAWLAAVRREWSLCRQLLDAAWERSGPTPAVAADIARTMLAQGQTGEMRAYLDAQVGAHPEWIPLLRERVSLLMVDGDVDGAVAASRDWLRRHPQNLEAKRQLSLLLVQYADEPGTEEGLALIQETLQVEPDNPFAYRAMAIGHARRNRLPEAEAALRKALSMQPDDPRLRLSLIEFLQNLGRDEEAEEVRRQAPPEGDQPPSALRKIS